MVRVCTQADADWRDAMGAESSLRNGLPLPAWQRAWVRRPGTPCRGPAAKLHTSSAGRAGPLLPL